MPVLPLTPGCTVQFEAINPTTGAPVNGVTVSKAVIYAEDQVDTIPASIDTGPFMYVPGPNSA